MDRYESTRLCQRCGHPEHVHQHYRSGTDCSYAIDLGGERWHCTCREFIGSRALWTFLKYFGFTQPNAGLRKLEPR